MAELYIPFRLFRIEITNRGVAQTEFFGLESVRGSMDLFRFDELPDTIVLETRNAVEPGIDEAEAAELVVSKVRRLLYSRGFFRMRDLRLESTALPGDVYVPYWIGFRGRGPKRKLQCARRRQAQARGGQSPADRPELAAFARFSAGFTPLKSTPLSSTFVILGHLASRAILPVSLPLGSLRRCGSCGVQCLRLHEARRNVYANRPFRNS